MKAKQLQANKAEQNKYSSEHEALLAKKKVKLTAKYYLRMGH